MEPGFRFACDGNRFVWVDYGPEEYRALGGGDADNYLEFLAATVQAFREAREEHLMHWAVRVPFDADNYAAWARENPEQPAGTDAHLAWAVQVARRPEHLASLRARHRRRCCVPADELLRVEITAWCLPVVVRDKIAASRLAAPLHPAFLKEVVQGLCTNLWRNATPFEQLSPRRACGFTAVPGDRLILVAQLEDLASAKERVTAWTDKDPPACFAVPAAARLIPPRSYPRLEVVGLPLVLLGAEDDVETASHLAFCADHAELPLEAWGRLFGECGVTFLEDHAHRFVFGAHAEGLAETIRKEICLARAQKGPPRRSRLRRVK